ncbi:hypothetical protein LF1_40730 [Rubripirellula obstinata]|uniref:Uncharacterized protein n=1 Tax=Rubripirellula obstinata TaxID=406547 RepID=A0A5B1CQ69_9BACT|nr:hypothetical protein [Rubripirellula obstinata]KAA1261523.1 hypothetical protein LF1_40730 [Rubripirellula obstinata]
MELKRISIAATVSVFLYTIIAWLSWQFGYDSEGARRPILVVISLFAVAFLVYLTATIAVVRSQANDGLLKWIVGAAIVFRLVMLFSYPIQEVDLYRYLWDGAVTGEGVSPFAHSPQSIRNAAKKSPVADLAKDSDGIEFPTRSITTESVQRLVRLVQREPGISEALNRVHFSELPTIYPVTSQAVFALVDVTTPSQSSLMSRVFIIKAWLIGFDIATMFTLIALLRQLNKPATWCIGYAWCPLLMKEVAGSGHLDAIAVFLTTLTVYLTVRLVTGIRNQGDCFAINRSLLVIGFVFALAIGAKLYPIVLAPLLLGCVVAKLGWRYTIVPTLTTCLITACLLWPMLPESNPESDVAKADPSEGVATFLKQWEMNDFLFLILIENLKPVDAVDPQNVAWFSVVPSSVRAVIHNQVTNDQVTNNQVTNDPVTGAFNIDAFEASFLASRLITLGIFFVVAIWLALRASRSRDVERICEAAFLTLAWFWLLAPTQNPWYWTWALPLLPFARGRAWFAVSGLVLLYYLRFWFEYHYGDVPVWGTRYRGVVFYDLVVTWIEFAPWMLFLAADAIRRSLVARGSSKA